MKKVELNSNQLIELFESSQKFIVPSWEFPVSYLAQFKDLPDTLQPEYLQSLKHDIKKNGYLLFDFSEILDDKSESEISAFVTYFINIFGKQIKIFAKLNSVWRKIKVDINKHPNKSEGIGESPLHMDFVNSEFPPDLVCLFAIRPDLFGGESTISRIEEIENHLSTKSIEILKQKIFSDGKVEGLSSIGKDINPFPVISNSYKWKYRFTANLLKSESGSSLDALNELYNILVDRQLSYKLEKYNLLLINQHKMLHGKMPLGPNQQTINMDNSRLLMHGFIKFKE